MKKLLSKIEPVQSSGHSQGSCIGRTWQLPKGHTVTVEEIIAEGGFGIVFLAKQGAQKFALKRIIVNNDHDLAVATREIQIMTSLGDHPNLLGCLDHLVRPLGGGVTECLGLMPFCKGSLLALLNLRMAAKSHLSEKEVLQILADVISGVGRLHQCSTPIIHRDLKIENVLQDEGKFVICDFGSCTPKFWDPSVHGVTATQEDLEKYTTLAYRSPEMVDLYSNRGPISTKADIWALGILLYKMCFYTTPFGDSILAIQSAQVIFPPTSPFSSQLHALIQYLLKANSSERPDIYQVAELTFSLLGQPNPISNVGGTPLPPSIESLVLAMTAERAAAKVKAEEKANKSTSVTPAPPISMPLETSVTPRQRPKGNMPCPVGVGPLPPHSLLPPPKSPKPIDSHNHSQISQTQNLQVNQPQPPATSATTTISSSTSQQQQPTTNNNNNNDLGHRRNASDSSAFDKASLQQNDIQSATSESTLSSWNPFAGDCFPTGSSTSTSTTNTNSAADPKASDDPFSNAPFDYFKYQPMPMEVVVPTVDAFGSSPFSNPFLEFSTPPPPHEPILNNAEGVGVTNLSFEDER